jgi:hypothetical protein
MNSISKQLGEVVLGAALLMLFSASIPAQSQAPLSEAGRISATLRSASYPEAIYPHGVMPDWDRGYVIHREIEVNYSPGAAMVVMYDAAGKRIREGRIWPQGAGSVRITRTAATREGAILATGWALMQDGSAPGFIAKTDLGGNTIQSVETGAFKPDQICEAPDGSVWSLGKAVRSDGAPIPDTEVVRHFSFEKGLLHSFMPENMVQGVMNSDLPWFVSHGSFLRCGKEKVSIYLRFTGEYAEINTSSFELKRWKLDQSVTQERKANGLAVTEDGRVYLSFRANGENVLHPMWGLYQIKAVPGNPVAELLPVAGTITPTDRGKFPPPGTFTMLWGADGNQLVVWRQEASDASLSWVNVIHDESTD